MTSKAAGNTTPAISLTAARVAIGAIVGYQVILIALIFIRPDLDPSWHTISEWAIGPHGWIMSAAFLISALSYAALFAMLRSQLRGTMGRIGLGILLICVIGAFGVGIFTTDPMPLHVPLSTIGTLHVIFGTSQLMLLPFAALLINLSLARKRRVDIRSAGSALDCRLAAVWLRSLRGVYRYFCVSHGSRCLWTRCQYWLAPAICIFYLHAVAGNVRLASNQVRAPEPHGSSGQRINSP